VDLEAWSACLRVLSDVTRVRLLALLEREELSVAELAAITHLAQPRVSTHLAKLKESGLVRDRRAGVSAYYRFAGDEMDKAQRALWKALSEGANDPLLTEDAQRLPTVLAARASEQNLADTVAGDMERHYSPGRTWEALARAALQLVEPGEVLDVGAGTGVLAELLAARASRYVCVDVNARAVTVARERLARFPNVEVMQGDMHTLAFPDASFDRVLMMHTLTYAADPASALAEGTRVLRRGGTLLATTLNRHAHRDTLETYGHANQGFAPSHLTKLARSAGLSVVSCAISTREKRPPHYEVIALLAQRP
jgi:ArsR family transcriptional regulator